MSEIRIPHRGEWGIIAAKAVNRIVLGNMAHAKIATGLMPRMPQSLEAPASGLLDTPVIAAGALVADALVDRSPAPPEPIIYV